MNYIEKIKKYREERDFSQRKMAAFLGITQSFLSLVERGKASIENEDVLKKIEELEITEEEEPTLRGKTANEILEAIAKKFEEQEDVVNSPKHYRIPGCNFETIDLIYAFVEGLFGELAVNVGNVVKYLARAERKNGRQDYEKARKYLEWANTTEFDISSIPPEKTLGAIGRNLGVDWATIITGLCEGMDTKKALLLNETFRCLAERDFEDGLKYLDELLAHY